MYTEVAKHALYDLRENGVDFPDDKIFAAEEYANEAYLELASMSTYDPFADSPVLARRAAIEYVKARLLGSYTSEPFLAAANVWTRDAAIHRKRANGR